MALIYDPVGDAGTSSPSFNYKLFFAKYLNRADVILDILEELIKIYKELPGIKAKAQE
jgi:hypothetical protein